MMEVRWCRRDVSLVREVAGAGPSALRRQAQSLQPIGDAKARSFASGLLTISGASLAGSENAADRRHPRWQT